MSFHDSDHIEAECMSDTDILLLTLDADTANNRAIDHLRDCGYCSGRVANLRHVVIELAARTAEKGGISNGAVGCLDESALARLVDDGTSATRDEIAHLIDCAHCRSELASLAALLGDATIAREMETGAVQRVDRRDRTRRLRLASRPTVLVALAAAAVVLLMVRSSFTTPAASVHRGPTIAASGNPTLIAPAGDAEAASTFLWKAVPGSDRYRLTLYNEAGHALYETQLNDTTLSLPDSVTLTRGALYIWQVEGRTGVDRWTPPTTVEFIVTGHRVTR